VEFSSSLVTMARNGSEKAGVTAEETTNKTGTKSFMNMIIVMGC